ncbi:unnamed protein product [Vicia faba]|uniref:Glycosyl transferase 48 domain-containing protein n=1 Tax=Vicia faba TaxID=3906 RepID=A0AAV0ZH45_VICFA|nr:unnamed protein product [Vicia faba]
MSIFEYNGSALVAMVGKNCFAIASDRRLGVQLQTIATDFQRISKIHDKLFIGLSGLATDSQTLYQRLVFRHKLYRLREERDMKPETFASLVSAILYEKRMYSRHGFVVRHEKFADNYRMYSRSHFVKGIELTILLICYMIYGSATTDSAAYAFLSWSMWFLVSSWLFAPFLFNPSGF